jgi:Ca2+-binding RTX toxin-like protein
MAVYRWGSTSTIATSPLANVTIGLNTDFSSGPSITALSNGGFAVAWTEGAGTGRSADFQIFDPTGQAVSGVIRQGSASGASYMPEITSLGSTITVTWTLDVLNNGNENVLLRQYNLAGAPLAGATSVAANGAVDENQPAIAATATGSVVAYTLNNADIALSLRNASGLLVSNVTVANSPNTQFLPAVAVLAQSNQIPGIGNIAVAWLDDTSNEYRLTIYNSNGVNIVNAANLLPATAAVGGTSYAPSIAALTGGGLVVAWEDGTVRPSDTDGFHIGYQIFSATGVKIGAERVANISPFDAQVRPDVVGLADGGFMVTWCDGRLYGSSGLDIYGARFDGDGNRVGSEFLLAAGGLRQADPAMALLSDGRVAVTWLDEAEGSLKLQILDPRDGVATGGLNNDVLYGHPILATQLSGEGLDDQLYGGNSADLLYGGEGNDTLDGGGGGDWLDGGTGNDTASYASALTGVTASLANRALNTGDAAGDIYVSIENLSGSAFADILTGDGAANGLIGGAGNDFIDAGAGDDTLDGGAGNDTLDGGAGADSLIGGGGSDMVTYGTVAAGVTARLDTPGVNTGDAAGDTYTGIAGFFGSSFADVLVGDGNANSLYGGGGFDYLAGQGGNDQVFGEAGNDVLDGNAGDDTLDGGSGDDVLNGGAGNDTLDGGAGADLLIGGGGFDMVTYGSAAAGVTARLDVPSLNTGDAAGDSYTGIAGLFGSSFADVLVGDGNANTLYGGVGGDYLAGLGGIDQLFGEAGNDILDGNAGDDTLNGGAGNDTLDGGAGADSLIGGGGFDMVTYGTAAAGVTARLDTPGVNTGDSAGDTYTGIAGFFGSSFADVLVGDGNANSLYGGGGFDYLAGQGGNDQVFGEAGNDVLDGNAGDDTLDGGSGDDVLNGGAGNDTLDGGAGADLLIGGGGFDMVTYGSAAAGVTAWLQFPAANTGDAAGDSYNGIAGLIGSGFADFLLGDANGNSLNGSGGNDLLFGGGGSDTFMFTTLVFGIDTVQDFATTAAAGVNHDFLDFRGIGIANLSAVAMSQVGADTYLVTSQGTVILQNILAGTLVGGDFLF